MTIALMINNNMEKSMIITTYEVDFWGRINGSFEIVLGFHQRIIGFVGLQLP